MSIIHPKVSLYFINFYFKSSISINPLLTLTAITLKLAKTADAGLVPWADIGIKQIFLWF